MVPRRTLAGRGWRLVGVRFVLADAPGIRRVGGGGGGGGDGFFYGGVPLIFLGRDELVFRCIYFSARLWWEQP